MTGAARTAPTSVFREGLEMGATMKRCGIAWFLPSINCALGTKHSTGGAEWFLVFPFFLLDGNLGVSSEASAHSGKFTISCSDSSLVCWHADAQAPV